MPFRFISQVQAADWLSISPDCLGQNIRGVDATDVASINGITCLIQNILSPVPALMALVAIGMLILAGIRLMTAGAEPKAIASAWSMFTWAIIGLVLLAGVWLVLVIIENFTGAPVTKFGLP